MLTKEKDKELKKRIVISFCWLLVLIIACWLGYDYSINNIGYQPSQPVAFSHKAHIEKYNMKCLYCHYSAEKSSFSNIPTTYSCNVCHVALRNESKLIKPINISRDSLIPIKWNSVYRLPDYTHFDHSRHIRALIDCASCHGEVEKQDSTIQSTALTMKWCLDCHRSPQRFIIPAREISGIFTNGINYINNKQIILAQDYAVTNPAYGLYETNLPRQVVKGIIMPKLPGRGPETCSACHY